MNPETPNPTTPPGAAAPPGDQRPPLPPSNKFGRGKVAHLPDDIIDDVGQMLLDGMPQAEIIRLAAQHGHAITDGNISNWKAAGFKKWQADFERRMAIKECGASARAILKVQPGDDLHLAATKLASAQINELLQAVDPTNLFDSIYEKPELYFRLVDAACRLNEGEAAANHHRALSRLGLAKLEAEKSNTAQRIPTGQEIQLLSHNANIT